MTKQYGFAVVLGSTLSLLAWTPQLRADGIDNPSYMDHLRSKNRLANDLEFADSQKSESHSSATWGPLDAHLEFSDNVAKRINWGHWWDEGSAQHSGTLGDGGLSTSSPSVATPEPSSLTLLLSSLVAAAMGMALRKAVT